ncbi:MAG TPA: hypothetical protein VJU61_18835 [Polyangiaceae bacterium]|nr:hypothetical protein [Polyangiaceae bacterium]
MKRTFLISSLMLLALGCARDPVEPPPAGGQSGDDGDILPPGPDVIDPGVPLPPAEPCDPEEASLALDAPTAFGGSALELLARLEPGAPSPLFWVPRSAEPATTFSPGPGEASLTFEIAARTNSGATATQTLWQPQFTGAACRDDNLRVPVQVRLSTSDGALDEQFDGVLDFTSASTAHLDAELVPDALTGSFAFSAIGAPGETWHAERLTVSADFWPGGSRGALFPSFTVERDSSATATPPPTSAAPSTPNAGDGILTPTTPTGWSSVAVWPRREACDSEGRGVAAAYAASDHIIGRSLADVVSEQNARSAIELTSARALTPVSFTLEAPTGLQCVRASGRSMTFDVRATLRAASGDAATTTPASALSNLAASSIFELTATSARDGSGIEALRWVRRDVVWAQDRAAFETATGIALDAAEQYRQVWWSWHGTETRASATAPWSSLGELAVHSLNAQQSAALERQQAQGGPGAGISFDEETHFPVLPGDALIEAEISP